jgi:hypothetical protein
LALIKKLPNDRYRALAIEDALKTLRSHWSRVG